MMDDDKNVVAAVTDHDADKYEMLEKVLELSNFFPTLDQAWEKSGKSKEDFFIAIKPNISMMLRRTDIGTYTDPFLVIHLLRLLIQKGYKRLAVMESQNLYGNWFENRSVVQVAARAGYFGDIDPLSLDGEVARDIHVTGHGVNAKVPLVDLTHDMIEADLGGSAGVVELGKTWLDADFRINFAKMKSHFYSYYTLAIKNIYGCLPLQDKVRGYHCKRAVGPWTAQLIAKYPVHFSIVDAYSAADGLLGVKLKAIARKTHTLIAGKDILAVDHHGAELMGVKAEKSVMYKELAKLTPPKPYEVAGNGEKFKKWQRIPAIMVWVCILIESSANLMDWAGSLATGGYDPCFPHKKVNRGFFKQVVFYLTLPVNILIDLGFLKLRFKLIMFFRKIRGNAEIAPITSNTPEILSGLSLLSKNDVKTLQNILNKWPQNMPSLTKPDFSGHYFSLNGVQIEFPARMTPSSLAMAEICAAVHEKGLDPDKLSYELAMIMESNRELFSDADDYASCFQ